MPMPGLHTLVSTLHRLLLLSAAMSAACESSSSPADKGTPDTRPSEIGLPKTEKTSQDRSPADAGPTGLPCINGLDLSPLQLESHHCIIARLDLTGAAPAAIAVQSNRLYTLQASGNPLLLEIKEHSFSASTSPTPFFTATATGSGKMFASDYLAVAPSGGTAAVGYTLESTDGAIFWGDRGGTPRRIDKANGNFRAVFLDQTTLVVNGIGMGVAQEGQGVYLLREGQPARRLVKDLGDYSGQLGLSGKVLFAGGYFTDTNKIYGFTLDEVKTAVQSGGQLATGTDGDLLFSGNVSDGTAFGEDLLLLRTDAAFKAVAVTRYPIKVSGKTVSADPPVDVVTIPSGSAKVVEKVSGWQDELGLLITGAGSSPQVALIRRKP